MNMVSLLRLGVVIKYNLISGTVSRIAGVLIALLCAVAIGWAICRANASQRNCRRWKKQFEQ